MVTDKLDNLSKLAFAQLASYMGGQPEWFQYVAWNESKFNPSAVNPISRAVGVFQFMPSTLTGLGYTFDQVKAMDLATQLKTVGTQYYKPYKGKIKNIYDAYLAVFYPYAIGKPDNYIFGSEKSQAYAKLVAIQNPIFDLNKDGLISVAEFRKYVDTTAIKLGLQKKSPYQT